MKYCSEILDKVQQWKNNTTLFSIVTFLSQCGYLLQNLLAGRTVIVTCMPHLLASNHVSSEFYVFTMQSQVSRTSHMNVSRLEIMFFYIAMIQVLLLCNLNGSRNTFTVITRKEILIDKLGRYSNPLVYVVFNYMVF